MENSWEKICLPDYVRNKKTEEVIIEDDDEDEIIEDGSEDIEGDGR